MIKLMRIAEKTYSHNAKILNIHTKTRIQLRGVVKYVRVGNGE